MKGCREVGRLPQGARPPCSNACTGPMSKRLFGRYRLRERLGVGGWAEVWRATDEISGDAVAVKRLHPQVARDGAARSRLRREAAAVSVIDSPGVVRVRDVVETDSEVALILDYVDGEPLSEIVARDGGLPRRRAIEVVRQVAEALAAAHAAGIVHRDVKPSNILLDTEGTAHLIDFGIAQSAEATSHLTGVGSVVGTLRYLPPEVLRGEPATPASDVWALSALAYLLIDGGPPYNGVVPAELVAEASSPPPAPRHAEPDLAALLVRGLDPDPASRPRDAGEFLAELQAIAADAPTVVLSLAEPTVQLAITPNPPPAPAVPGAGTPPAPTAPRPRGVAATERATALAAEWRTAAERLLSRVRRRRLPALAATVLATVLGVAVLVAAFGGVRDLASNPDGAAAAGLASPSVPSASPADEGSGDGGPGGGKGKGNNKGKGGGG